jgi:hypothetical protein
MFNNSNNLLKICCYVYSELICFQLIMSQHYEFYTGCNQTVYFNYRLYNTICCS